jgi:hypothetical protein
LTPLPFELSADLPPEVRAVCLHLVESFGPNHWHRGDLQILEQYGAVCVELKRAREGLARDGAVGPDGKATAWIRAVASLNAMMAKLSTRLRLGPQSRHDRLAAGRAARPQATMPKKAAVQPQEAKALAAEMVASWRAQGLSIPPARLTRPKDRELTAQEALEHEAARLARIDFRDYFR